MKRKVVTDPKSPLFDFDDFNKSCNSKTAYTTPYHAQYAIDMIESRNHNIRLTFYKCPYCNNYHLTEK